MKKLWCPLVVLLLFPATVSAERRAGQPLETPKKIAHAGDSIQYRVQASSESTLYFPDYVDGGGWSIQLALSNIDPNRSASVIVTAYDSQGQEVSGLFDSGSRFEISARGSRVLRSAGAGGAVRRGWIEVRSEIGIASVRGLLTYRDSETGVEVGVEPVPLSDHFALFVETSSDIGAGLAIYKPDASSEIEFRLRDDAGSDPLAGRLVSHGNFRQRARTIPQWFEEADTEFLRDFRGLLFLRTRDGSPFAPVGLRFGTTNSSLSAVPVTPMVDVGKKMYWADLGTGKIRRANLDGTEVEDLVTSGFVSPKGLALGRYKMYWTNSSKIQRANLDGTEVEDLVRSGLDSPWGLALDLDAGKMYWTDSGTHKIQRANLDGSEVEDLVRSGLDGPRGLALDPDAGKMYWTDIGTDKIQRANLDGTGVEDLVTGLPVPWGLALDLDVGKMYWTDWGTEKIQWANLDGTEVEDLVTGLDRPRNLALDLDRDEMYWTQSATDNTARGDKIQRANLDGTEVEDLITSGLVSPQGLALDLRDLGAQQMPTAGPLHFPDYVDGGGWSVQLVLGNTNTGTLSDAMVRVSVYDSEGEPVQQFFETDTSFEIPGMGSRVLRSTGSGAIRRGWIEVESYSPWESGGPSIPTSISGLLTYRNSKTGIEVGVQPVELGTKFALFVEESSDIGTGLAIFKPDSAPEIEFRIRDKEGNDPIGRVLTRGDFQQRARTLPEWLEGTDPQILRDFQGLLLLRAADGSSFAPVGLRFGKGTSSLSAVPPIHDVGKKMYWVDGTTERIRRANLDGTEVEDLVTSSSQSHSIWWPRDLALDLGRGKMYWTVSWARRIQRANLDGTQIEDLVTSGLDSPATLALDLNADKIYWTDSGTHKIQRANLDGTEVEDLVTGLSRPHGLALDLDAGKMYWMDSGTDQIRRANLDGTEVEDLVSSGLEYPRELALDLDAGKMYWTDSGTHKIQRANLDGTEVEDLVRSGLDSPWGVALDLDAGKMYWTDSGTDKIQRANLDGTEVEDLVSSGLDSPLGLALDLDRAP